jgi:predicted dehydrogenase
MTVRLGVLGAGWIGRDRMRAVVADGLAEVVAVADPAAEVAREAAVEVGARVVPPDELLAGGYDGVLIATPSALHAEQAVTALNKGMAVFCQKPLGRTAAECAVVVGAARRADLLLAADLSYRHLRASTALRDVIAAGGIGEVYAADLVFHNAYGPDKAWFLDPALAGGGCVIDLGIHLVDLALWMLDRPKVAGVSARLFAGGRPLGSRTGVVEDHALARVDLASGAVLTVACSWFLHAGRDAVIDATFFGTSGAVTLHNVAGSFYDFRAERLEGTRRTTLVEPPDAWGGRAAVAWARRLAAGARFDPAADELVEVAAVLDGMYGR